MSYLFNKPGITIKDVEKAYEYYCKDNKQIILKSFKTRYLSRRYTSCNIGSIIFQYDKKLAVKFDFYMIDLIEKTIKKERVRKRIIAHSHNLALLYFNTADHLSQIFSDFEKVKLFYLRGIDLDPQNVNLMLRYGLVLAKSDVYNDKMNAYQYIHNSATLMTKAVWTSDEGNNLNEYLKYIEYLMEGRQDNSKLVLNLLKEGYKIAKYCDYKDDCDKEIIKKYAHILFNGYKSVKPNPKHVIEICKSLNRVKIELKSLLTEKMIKYFESQPKRSRKKKTTEEAA